MDLPALERRLHAADARAVVVDGRVLRRVIKAHRDLPGLGLSVPHAGCYVIPKSALLRLLDPALLGHDPASLLDPVILVARPSPADLAGRTAEDVLARLWRAAFHAEVHLAIEARALSDAAIRARIDRLGQIEFDEIRAALRDDDRLFSRDDDREVYTEFAALFLELRHFAPRLCSITFPALPDDGRVDAVLAEDVTAKLLLDRSFPEGAERAATVARSPARSGSTTRAPTTRLRFGFLESFTPAVPTPAEIARLETAAEAARRRGNLVRAAILSSIAGSAGEPGTNRSLTAAKGDLEALGARLNAALTPPGEEPTRAGGASWTALLAMLAEQAAARRVLVYPVEARLLYDLQRAAVAHERPERAVDLVAWAVSRGKTPIVRPLPATRAARVARSIRRAERKARHARMAAGDRKLLAKLLGWASERADYNVRAALRPGLRDALDAVGLKPENVPERVARAKLIEEILDQAVDRGFISIGHLRDALSRNQLKLDNLGSARELWDGDALLQLDRRLAESLDGVYRGGEIYLRFLQKVSSVGFGTDLGRMITLYATLPLLAAYVILMGGGHLVTSLAHLAGHRHEILLLNLWSFPLTAALVFGNLHSSKVRAVSWKAATLLGAALSILFLRVPRWILARPAVRRFLASTFARATLWKVLLPFGATAAITFFTPLGDQRPIFAFAGSALIFGGLAALMASPLGTVLEDAVLDRLGPALQAVGRRVLPGLWRLITETFRTLVDLVERLLYRVDEWLRFREGDLGFTLWPKAVFGVFWFAAAYVVRLYITLLIEPELNPVKHFPVCTVSHKLMLPVYGDVLRGCHQVFSPLGSVIGGTMAATTAFFLPSVAGFLVWELKENWKLYRGTRPKALRPSAIGHHGETLGALLVPGFHSGTLPKVFSRWRRAAQREDEAALTTGEESKTRGAAGSRDGRFREGLHDVEEAVRRFVERELSAVLGRAPRWTAGPVEVGAVELGSNRIRVRLTCASLGREPCELSFEEQSGRLVAGIPRPGFLAKLPAEGDGRRLFENALGGLYQLAGVDLVREQLADALGPSTPYDIADDGLLVWPGEGYRTEVVYELGDGEEPRLIAPRVRGDIPATPPREIDEARLRYRLQRIPWTAWVRAWNAAAQADTPIPRLTQGASLLPGPPG